MAEYIVKDKETGEILCQGSVADCSAVIGCDERYVKQMSRTDYKYNSKYSMYKVERIGGTNKRGGAHWRDTNCLGCGMLMKNVSTSQKRCPECARKHRYARDQERKTRLNEDGFVANRRIKKEKQDGCEGCIYLYGDRPINRCCNYIFDTGKRRPCPPAEECTVKVERKRYREKEK